MWIVFALPPQSLMTVVGALAPVAAFGLLAVAGPRFTATGSSLDARTPLMGLFAVGAALGIRNLLFEHTLLDATPLLIAAVAIGLGGLGALWLLDRAVFGRGAWWALVAVLLNVWAYGVLTQADVQFDRIPARVYTTQVIDKQRSAHWEVILAPWGPRAGPTIVNDANLYKKVQLGQQVCVALHRGALGMPWREVVPCQDADTAKA